VNKRIAKKIEDASYRDMRTYEETRYWRAYNFLQRTEAFHKDTKRRKRKAAAVRAKRGWVAVATQHIKKGSYGWVVLRGTAALA
jgi:hypothetical protein